MAEMELARIIDRQGWAIKELEKTIDRTDANVEDIRRDVKDVVDKQREDHEAFARYVAVAETATRAAEKVAERAVTSRQLYVSFILAVCAVVGTLIGIHT